MNRVSKALATGAGLLLWVGPVGASQDVDAELAEMRELVKGLQMQVDAQQEQMAQQGEMLEDAQAVVRQTQQDASAVSGLASFLESVEIEGWVAGSYTWNLNEPDDGLNSPGAPLGSPTTTGNGGVSGNFYPFHPDHNSFSVDQLWFGIGKPATEESRAGFRADIVYGRTAKYLGQGAGNFVFNDDASALYVHQAYVEYLAGIGEGVNLKFGKFGTLTGAEVAQTTQNFNITRSALYSFLQPIDHVGLLASSPMGPVEVTFGYVNSGGSSISSPDDNKEKSYIVGLGFGQDNMSANVTWIHGAENTDPVLDQNSPTSGLVDVVVTFDPSDNLSLWINGDYAYTESSAASAWGIAAAGRVALNDKLGLSARAEYLADKAGNTAGGSSGPLGISNGSSSGEAELWGITGTIDYTLVENLMVRGEVRYDKVRSRGTGEFHKDNTVGVSSDQTVLLAEVVYTF